MNLTELNRLLDGQPGPFADAVLSDAYRDTPDVPGIHGDVRQRLRSLINECRAQGTPRIQVITGDPGDGKTHLLAWLRRESEASWASPESSQFALAPIAPLRAVGRPFHHFLQETIWHLGRTLYQREHMENDSPLAILLWQTLRHIIRLLGADGCIHETLASRVQSLASTPAKFPNTFATDVAQDWAGIKILRREAP